MQKLHPGTLLQSPQRQSVTGMASSQSHLINRIKMHGMPFFAKIQVM